MRTTASWEKEDMHCPVLRESPCLVNYPVDSPLFNVEDDA